MACILKIIGAANGGVLGIEGWYLKEYDPTKDAPAGERCMWFTPNIAEAKVFATAADAGEEWRKPLVTKSGNIRIRRDGNPDRPLTAFTVEIMPAEEVRQPATSQGDSAPST